VENNYIHVLLPDQLQKEADELVEDATDIVSTDQLPFAKSSLMSLL
jgi:hypothetical protein